MDIVGKKNDKPKTNNGIVATIVLGFFTIMILSFILMQSNNFTLFNDAKLYIGIVLSIIWWAFSFSLVFLSFKLFSERVATIAAVIIFIILILVIGIQGSIFLGHNFGYPTILSILIYFLGPSLLAFVLFLYKPLEIVEILRPLKSSDSKSR